MGSLSGLAFAVVIGISMGILSRALSRISIALTVRSVDHRFFSLNHNCLAQSRTYAPTGIRDLEKISIGISIAVTIHSLDPSLFSQLISYITLMV